MAGNFRKESLKCNGANVDIFIKVTPLNTINHNTNKETTTNARKKYGLLICAANAKLQNSQVQYANPHGCLHYSNLQG